ncbi:MAG: hypothetical protein WC899_10255 [bacterium]|jgi:hypothetical protein
MIIQGSSVLLAARQETIRQTTEKESLRMWVGNERPDFEGRGRAAAAQPQSRMGDVVSLSGKCPAPAEGKPPEDDEAGLSAKDRTRIYLVEKMVERFTGRKVKIRPLKHRQEAGAEAHPPERKEGAEEGTKKAGWGFEYDATTTRYEKETVQFRASGVVRTADGQEITFDLNLQLSREEYEEASVHLRAGDAKQIDPLVINFDGSAAQLTDTKFAFDLNADGTKENVSFLQPGSGFLVLDRNGDGTATDGSELFGTSTGNGFAELSAYDADKNGWIDENDPVYKDLGIWTKDAAGTDALNTLAQQKVGAIFLGSVGVDFALKGAGNVENGAVKQLGVWLPEDGGTPGVVSQVDLTA